MRYYQENADEVIRKLGSSKDGLTDIEAARRLEENGKNQLAAEKGKSLIRKFLEQLLDPMTIILIVAAIISGVLAFFEEGSEGFVDVVIIMAVVIVNAVLGVYQESKAENAIKALQEMSKATSRVLRDGRVIRISSEDIVVGDIVLLEAGDAVPADGRIIQNASLKVEEAALTGESVPVTKFIDIINLREGEKDVPLGDRKNMLYSGSTVVYGRGTAVITATGMDTEMGKIADALTQAKDGRTPLQKKLAGLSKILTWLVLGVCGVVFAVKLLYSFGDWNVNLILDSFMAAVSLAVAAIPEGLATVVTLVLSMGVTNMSKRNAIIRKLTAVETLGCAEIICSDKTGTLTQNRMTVVDHFGDNAERTATAMSLCSDAELDRDGNVTGEPTEAALVAYAKSLSLPKYELKTRYERVGEAPFDSDRKMMSTVHSDGDGFIQFTKGAPDIVIARCTHYLEGGVMHPMTEEYRNGIFAANKAMADKALRVLAAAERRWAEKPEREDGEYLEKELCFVGLCGMIDPVRPEVCEAIVRCREAGIRPIMITGDHIDTAVAIAKELGIIENESGAITGSMLNDMSDEEFEARFRDISVYARVQPEHKTRIVNAWKKFGKVTAMTGDGVNDAPSIKAADIGVGMGITGTDVTKNVADMVLADDNFATIVSAVEEGRRIYDNIRKAIQFLLGSNMSEVIAIFAAVLLGFTVLEPVHLLWINLVTDCFPAIALGMEKGESNLMKRKPRHSNEGIFASGMGIDVAYQGFMVAALVLTSYLIGSGWTLIDSPKGMTMAFLTMSMAEIFHSFNMRSQRGSIFGVKSFNKVLVIAGLCSLLATTLVCEIEVIAGFFSLVPLSAIDYLIALALAITVIPIVEIVKLIQRSVAKSK